MNSLLSVAHCAYWMYIYPYDNLTYLTTEWNIHFKTTLSNQWTHNSPSLSHKQESKLCCLFKIKYAFLLCMSIEHRHFASSKQNRTAHMQHVGRCWWYRKKEKVMDCWCFEVHIKSLLSYQLMLISCLTMFKVLRSSVIHYRCLLLWMMFFRPTQQLILLRGPNMPLIKMCNCMHLAVFLTE